jgi:hypothetical protein
MDEEGSVKRRQGSYLHLKMSLKMLAIVTLHILILTVLMCTIETYYVLIKARNVCFV